MTNCAMHIQQKKRDTFDRENRVIPVNVIAVSTDAGDLRVGDGVTSWRNLPHLTAVEGVALDESDLEKDSMYSGPLHVALLTEEETDAMGDRVPDSNELYLLNMGNSGFVIGDGIRSMADLPVYEAMLPDGTD